MILVQGGMEVSLKLLEIQRVSRWSCAWLINQASYRTIGSCRFAKRNTWDTYGSFSLENVYWNDINAILLYINCSTSSKTLNLVSLLPSPERAILTIRSRLFRFCPCPGSSSPHLWNIYVALVSPCRIFSANCCPPWCQFGPQSGIPHLCYPNLLKLLPALTWGFFSNWCW